MVKNIEKIEISLMVILPWVSYLGAQMLGLSGIVSLLFNGIAHATYTKPNLTDWSKIVKKIYKILHCIHHFQNSHWDNVNLPEVDKTRRKLVLNFKIAFVCISPPTRLARNNIFPNKVIM